MRLAQRVQFKEKKMYFGSLLQSLVYVSGLLMVDREQRDRRGQRQSATL